MQIIDIEQVPGFHALNNCATVVTFLLSFHPIDRRLVDGDHHREEVVPRLQQRQNRLHLFLISDIREFAIFEDEKAVITRVSAKSVQNTHDFA